jgi:putative pyruvate formate lyase activating enzyme
VDIYLPDMKYMDGQQAAKYSSGAWDYPSETQKAVEEMHRQVGQHQTNNQGIAVRGLMIRHLVMPNRVAGTEKFVKWVAESLPKTTYLNIMHQYHVAYKAFDYPDIWRGITIEEYLEAMRWADEYRLTNLDPNSVKIRNFLAKHESRD